MVGICARGRFVTSGRGDARRRSSRINGVRHWTAAPACGEAGAGSSRRLSGRPRRPDTRPQFLREHRPVRVVGVVHATPGVGVLSGALIGCRADFPPDVVDRSGHAVSLQNRPPGLGRQPVLSVCGAYRLRAVHEGRHHARAVGESRVTRFDPAGSRPGGRSGGGVGPGPVAWCPVLCRCLGS